MKSRGERSEAEFDRVKNTVATLLLEALSDSEHPLNKDYQELVALSKGLELQKALKSCEHNGRIEPNRLLFLPQPGISLDPRRFWPLQLLLQTAARANKHSAALADKLVMSEVHMRQALDQAAHLSVHQWSPWQYWDLLQQAIVTLDYPGKPFPFRLEGRQVLFPANVSLRLSIQQEKMLHLLLENAGRRAAGDTR